MNCSPIIQTVAQSGGTGRGIITTKVRLAGGRGGVCPIATHRLSWEHSIQGNLIFLPGSDMNGVAVINACKILVERLEPYRTSNPDGKWEDWISKAYLERVNLNAFGFYDLSKVDYNFMENSGTSFDYLVFGAGCIEVEVDCHTGDIQVMSVDIVMDVGRSLNPAIDIGQVNELTKRSSINDVTQIWRFSSTINCLFYSDLLISQKCEPPSSPTCVTSLMHSLLVQNNRSPKSGCLKSGFILISDV